MGITTRPDASLRVKTSYIVIVHVESNLSGTNTTPTK
jgi:hypothetical protein